MSDFILSPADIGLPQPKFNLWRPNQASALNQVVDDLAERRFAAYSLPTGAGKSPWYVALALLMGWRVIILTSTKALQDQLVTDFGAIGLTDIRGRDNFQCKMSQLFTCEDGAHARCLYNNPQG